MTSSSARELQNDQGGAEQKVATRKEIQAWVKDEHCQEIKEQSESQQTPSAHDY